MELLFGLPPYPLNPRRLRQEKNDVQEGLTSCVSLSTIAALAASVVPGGYLHYDQS
jgi:hypothetical protein